MVGNSMTLTVNSSFPVSPVLLEQITQDLSLPQHQVAETLKLLLDDCTVPFIARYRKEATGGLDEVQIRDIRDKHEYYYTLQERKETILKSIEEQGKLTPPLRAKIEGCLVRTQLEDLYLPYKPKKRSRGQVAKERGLEPVALRLLGQEEKQLDVGAVLLEKVGSHEDLKTLEQVSQGVQDYIAECLAEDADIRGVLRAWTFENAVFVSSVREEHKETKTKFSNYYQFSEPVKSIAPHRLMALRRGEKENILKVNLEFDADFALGLVEENALKQELGESMRHFLKGCAKDAYQRLLNPSIETELRLETKSSAEEEAIKVFAKNLRNLLLLPPIPRKVVLGIDPGLRTGSKLVVVDQTGKLLEHLTIFPDHEKPVTHERNANAVHKILDLLRKHKVQYVSIGNGTAGREMDDFVSALLAQNKDLAVRVVTVNEAGASVYSASDVAREEFPELDLTYRGSVSIARRLQDPLAELVKIDPKSIGVGQYQHDVNQSKLKKSLEEVVESCVNYVGVNVNTASPSLLSYVAGIGPSLAKQIVRHREQKGEFQDREQLFEVMGYGAKTFEQSAGFLRIAEGKNILDRTGVHPERYLMVQKMAQDISLPLEQLLGNRDVLKSVDLSKYVSEEVGLPTLQDIIKELLKPGRDPREDGAKHVYNREVKTLADLKEGQILLGTVTNVTNFGAFVDIGVHQDGLIHVSELSSQFVKDASQAISVGDPVRVMVIGIDRERKRISLSKKAVETGVIPGQGTMETSPSARAGGEASLSQRGTSALRSTGKAPSADGPRNQTSAIGSRNAPKKEGGMRGSSSTEKPPAAAQGPASLQDLLSKFNNRRV
jgi:uncharacterized protein